MAHRIRTTSNMSAPERLMIEACLFLILENGPRSFGVQDVVDRAGVSQSSFFRAFRSFDGMMERFWSWCWDQLFSDLQDRLAEDTASYDSRSRLLRVFDYVWELDPADDSQGIAFLCFTHYGQRTHTPHSDEDGQVRYERYIRGLCKTAVDEAGRSITPHTLETFLANWCATVLKAWRFIPEARQDFSTSDARLGLQKLIDHLLDVPAAVPV